MTYRVILPSIYKEYTDACLASMSDSFRSRVILRDNTSDNIGVTPSWNMGVKEILDKNIDWLVLLSAAIRFKDGGDDLANALDANPDLDVIEATDVFGWHLIAFNRRLFEKVGYFDENLTNYFSDLDFSLRIQKAYAPANAPWEKLSFATEDMGMGHGVKLAGVTEPADPKILYFVQKWGRHPGAWQLGSYETPFNEEINDIKYFPGMAKI